jgi:hypothetical protein
MARGCRTNNRLCWTHTTSRSAPCELWRFRWHMCSLSAKVRPRLRVVASALANEPQPVSGGSALCDTLATSESRRSSRAGAARTGLHSRRPTFGAAGVRACAMPRTQPPCRRRPADCMARMMRKSNRARSPSDAALLLLSDIWLLVRHAPSSRGVLLLSQDAIAALIGFLAIVRERDWAGPRGAPWR